MTENAADRVESPLDLARRSVRTGWNTLLTVYYANTLAWRGLKAGALLFFGFFLWAGSNVLHSYVTTWDVLHYAAAYGFLLIVYGPVHHLVVIPVYLRLKRRGTHLSLGGHLTLPNGGLALFLVSVVVVGALAPGFVTLDFRSSLEDAGADVDPDIHCVKATGAEGETVHCHLTESTGVDRVVVRSGGETLVADDDPPFEFTVRTAELTETAGEKRFRVELLDADGALIRRYSRSLSMIDEAD